MKKFMVVAVSLIQLAAGLSGQKEETITVKAGTKLLDYFTVQERYLYPEFTTGTILLRSGITSVKQLNYNLLAGEMEFTDRWDTLSIANKRDIRMITLEEDTFFYDKGYIEQIRGDFPVVGLKQFYELLEVQKKDSYGVASSGGASTSYSTMPADGRFHDLIANKDMVFRKTLQYYISTPGSGFHSYSRKNVMKLFPGNKDQIRSYLKDNKVRFDSRDDLLRLAEYLGTLSDAPPSAH
jgi:hypothetical protein